MRSETTNKIGFKRNGKQPHTKTNTTMSTPWKKGYRTGKKKMETAGSSESELHWTELEP
jgi:hypothetical protein